MAVYVRPSRTYTVIYRKKEKRLRPEYEPQPDPETGEMPTEPQEYEPWQYEEVELDRYTVKDIDTVADESSLSNEALEQTLADLSSRAWMPEQSDDTTQQTYPKWPEWELSPDEYPQPRPIYVYVPHPEPEPGEEETTEEETTQEEETTELTD